MFVKVVIPLAVPGISAALFAFLASFDELIISLFLSGVRAQTLPVRIWNSLHMEIEPIIAAVSAFLIGVTALFVAGRRHPRHTRPGVGECTAMNNADRAPSSPAAPFAASAQTRS